MVTNIETRYRLETEPSNFDFSASEENKTIGKGECASEMEVKGQKDLNLPGFNFSCHNVLLTEMIQTRDTD